MTLATSCPACGTVFKIVEDQLKVSEGWVRCGHCQEVFNALEGLFDLAGRERPALGAPAPGARTTGTPPSQRQHRSGARASSGVSTRSSLTDDAENPAGSPATDRPDSRRGSIWDLAAARQHEQRRQAASQTRPPSPSEEPAIEAPGDTTGPGPSVVSSSAPTSGEAPDAHPDLFDGREPSVRGGFHASPPRRQPAPVTSESPIDAVDLSEADTVFLTHDLGSPIEDSFDALAPVRPRAAEDDEAAARWRPMVEADLHDPVSAAATAASLSAAASAVEPMPPLPAFVRRADRAARWQRPGMRVALGLACLLTATGLAAQVLLHHRDGAAARWPVLRAPLEALCAPLDCTIQAPRQIDALVVESTALTRPAGVDGYRLQVLLRNRAEFAVLAPHVELSLTDAGGAVVVRRVLPPTDFHQTDTLAGNQESSWQLELTSSDKRVAGYTVAVFYP